MFFGGVLQKDKGFAKVYRCFHPYYPYPMKLPEKILELYQFEECPYCNQVRTALTYLGMTYMIHNVPRMLEERDELEKVSGQRFVPVLVDPNTDTIIADDDEKAVEYLNEHYGGGG